MSTYKRGSTYHYEFEFGGQRYRGSCRTRNRVIAEAVERKRRRELEEQAAGVVSIKRTDTRLLREVVEEYLEVFKVGRSKRLVDNATSLLDQVLRHLGDRKVCDLTEPTISRYMQTRLKEKVGNRTVNMEVQILARAIGQAWRALWPRLSRLKEPPTLGRALTPEELTALLDAATSNKSPLIFPIIAIAAATAMRIGEIKRLTWGQVNLEARTLRVGRAKTQAGTGRIIPINDELLEVLLDYQNWWAKEFGRQFPSYYLFPFGENSHCPTDPARPVTDVKKAWGTVRRVAGVRCRFHDLRHTALSRMGEAGVPEQTMMSIAGHINREMLERYCHSRIEAKREAVKKLKLR